MPDMPQKRKSRQFTNRPSTLDDEQFKRLAMDLDDIKNLLILIASKLDATTSEIGKVLGLTSSPPKKVLAGLHRKKKP